MRWKRAIITGAVLFTLAAVLGVTIWAAKGEEQRSGQLSEAKESKVKVEQMIKRGKLSKHPARYWRKLYQ